MKIYDNRPFRYPLKSVLNNTGSFRIAWINWIFVILILMWFPARHVRADVFEANSVAWSGYWWPYANGGLITGKDYRGRPAPIEKYELYTQGQTPGELAAYYNANFNDPDAEDWYGLCGYWARAAAAVNVEILPSVNNNILFRVGDKKGLLTLAYTSGLTESADGSFPEVFHFWLLNYIRDQKVAFAADLDAGFEVWTYPIYRYDMTSVRNGNVESVSVKIYFANDMVHPDYMGTKELTKTYTYNLFLDDEGNIEDGEWTGYSVTDHPQHLSIALSPGQIPGLDYNILLDIAQSRDDELETHGISRKIDPGTYYLVLLDEDLYRIESPPGSQFRLRIEKLEGSQLDMDVQVTDASGDVIQSAFVSEDSPLVLTDIVEDPPYKISITQEDYTDPNLYTLTLDVMQSHREIVPYIPRAKSMWSGFAVTNIGDDPVDGVTLTTFSTDASNLSNPIQTVLGPVVLKSGEKRLFLFDQFPIRPHELDQSGKLVLDANSDTVQLLNLFGAIDAGPLAGFRNGKSGNHLIIPDTIPTMTHGKTMSGEIINTGFSPAHVTIRIYSQSGDLKDESIRSIEPWQLLPIRPGNSPFKKVTSGGWIEIIGDPQDSLLAYQSISTTIPTATMESLFALIPDNLPKFVPHVPETGFWQASVTLINPNNESNRITIFPKRVGSGNGNDQNVVLGPGEKQVVDIQSAFPVMPGSPGYRSILELTGELPFAGYYRYTTPTDDVCLPLIETDDVSDELILPHYTGNDGYWWTGIGIGNPGNANTLVRAIPYNENGDAMNGDEKQLTLEGGSYEVFTGVQLFGAAVASDIAFVRFVSQGPSLEGISGFYLYGLHTGEKLAGANM